MIVYSFKHASTLTDLRITTGHWAGRKSGMAEWRNSGMTEWRNGGIAEMAEWWNELCIL